MNSIGFDTEDSKRPKKAQIQYTTDAVIKLSMHELSPEKERVLASGFKFRPSRKDLPIEEIIVATETLIKTTKNEPGIATRLRNTDISEIDNMNILENKEEDTAILDNTTYLSKLQDRITSHEKIDTNPAPKHERRLNAVLTKMCKASKTNEPDNKGSNQNISSAENH